MCGIAGVLIPSQTISPGVLEPMAERLAHRGPDGRGFFTEGPVGLAHTRLSIIDLEGGQQPILTDDGRMALVANGEIYNYVELMDELRSQGRSFSTHSDSETILQAYALDPTGFVERLHGMFAFAIYDEVRRKLVLGRDRLGIKPLFYAHLADRFVFASEMKAILPLLGRAPAMDPEAFSQYLHTHCTTGEQTIFSGIKRVRPGEVMEVALDLTVERRRYWTALDVAPRTMSQQEAEEEFEPLFHRVMTEHVRSDVPYGLFLSGGNDSAIMLAMLSRLQDHPVRTFSVGYDDADFKDELSDAQRVAEMFGSEHMELRLDRAALFRRIPHHIWAADDLMRDYAALPTSALSEAAARELKVVFSGEGGDEVFGGYRRYRQPSLVYFARNLTAPGSGGFRTRSEWWRRRSRNAFGPELAALRPRFRAPYRHAWSETPAEWSHLQRCQYTDLVTDLTDSLLLKVDRMMMGFSLEGRVPFLDHEVVEFGLGLPDALKTGGGQTKAFLRKWAERYLPRDHLYTKKRGFGVPVREWLSGGVLDALEGKLLANAAVAEWFDTDRLPDLIGYQRRTGRAAREVFCLTQFAIWHRLFIEGGGGAIPSVDEDPLAWMD
jgi:asparagine synthase (glutamine-hydrolysing)